MASILYHCTCTSASTASNVPPEPTLPSSAFAFHALHTLYFCEECDLVRCNRCVSVEVSGYYCPNCLFEVPSASVRAEKNRCARNCFQCPHCRNTLSVVPSDPPEEILAQPRPPTANESIGEPPFFLYCNFCRWDSQEVGIVFEKPTGLALQLQKLEDNLPDSLEFERLKDHFEPILRASSSSHHNNPQPSHHRNPITAAASSALARDVPGLHQSVRGMSGRTYSNPKAPSRINANKSWDDWDSIVYKSRLEVAGSGVGIRIESELDWIKALDEGTGIERVADLERRWLNSWTQSLKSRQVYG
ncbi:hypothetical protein FRC05_001539 [Tulasnella sp. 425]|nr:hypothetical protein FRC05_001539 [Tulasnella sp. 425]